MAFREQVRRFLVCLFVCLFGSWCAHGIRSVCGGASRTWAHGVHGSHGCQLDKLLGWYQGWTGAQRDQLYAAMLERTPRDPLASLTTAMSFRLQTGSQTSDSFSSQLEQFCEWFAQWGDSQRNTMLNALEEVDTTRVDSFIEKYKRLHFH
jgi:hypothetical protein